MRFSACYLSRSRHNGRCGASTSCTRCDGSIVDGTEYHRLDSSRNGTLRPSSQHPHRNASTLNPRTTRSDQRLFLPPRSSGRSSYGTRSMAARPLAISTGSETCSCVINHLSFDRWKPLVVRTQYPTSRPSFRVPLALISICAAATSPLSKTFKSRISWPIALFQ
jgi:hypothetical protein